MKFTADNFRALCDKLSHKDPDLHDIVGRFGYPPMWTRPQNFATLIRIILEQQVSLASANAAYNKLKSTIGTISPSRLLSLSAQEMKACYFSRQKTLYARHLAESLLNKQLRLSSLSRLREGEIRRQLKQIKGIGDWTVDVYLLFALQRCDVFPTGDLAMMNAIREIKLLPAHSGKEKILAIAEQWRPYRSIATYLLWHYYIQTKGIKVL